MNTPVPIRRNDLLLAVDCGILQATALTLGYGSWARENYAALVCLGGVQGIALVLWRRHPMVCQLLVWGEQLAMMVLMPRGFTFTWVAQAVAGFDTGLRSPPLRDGLLAGVLGLAEAVAVVVRESPDPGRWAEVLTFVLGKLSSYLLPVLDGVILTSWTQRMRQQRDWETREHQHQLDLALTDERRRITGELHDVTAHHLVGIVVQSAAVGRLIDCNPGAVRETATQLRAQSKETLDGLRSVMGPLRRNATPVTGLHDLPELIAATRDLEVEVSFVPPFPRPALSLIADRAVYRVVQQAISNILQHAPGAWLRIDVTQTGDQLETTIVNDSAQRQGESRTGGVGLKVMRERAVVAGGTLGTGPTPEGGWRVRLVVPVTGGGDEEER